ncbi:MAG: hypothetical protein ACM3TU_01880 [Bacillota bacterium]
MTQYLTPCRGGKWAVSGFIKERQVCLIERSKLDNGIDPRWLLASIGISPSDEELARYFPAHPIHGPCPTLDLLELFVHRAKTEIKRECGV